MLRPDDTIEIRRKLLRDAVRTVRGEQLKAVRTELGVGTRIPADQLGWMAAFKDYPFSMQVATASNPVKFADIENGVVSSVMSGGLFSTVDAPEDCWCAWRQNSSRSWSLILEEEARKLIARADEFYPEAVESASPSAENMLKASHRYALKSAINDLLSIDLERRMIAFVGTLGDMTPHQAIAAAKIARRMGQTKQLTYRDTGYSARDTIVEYIMTHIDSTLIFEEDSPILSQKAVEIE